MSMIKTIDQMGNQLSIPYPPKRIISLVPSQTELLFDLGLDDSICGITKFCVHPADKIKHAEKIGGTKKFNMDKIHALRPDLIIGNKEENYVEGIEELQRQYPIWMSDIGNLADAYSMIREVSRIIDKENEGQRMAEEILLKFDAYVPLPGNLRATYFIWCDPYMVAAGDTFINEMLNQFGVRNAFTQLTRYPEITSEMIEQLSMDVNLRPHFIFLSTEPYPFREKHLEEFQALFPTSRVMLVDGEYFSWYGSRLLKVPGYFEELKEKCSKMK